MPADAIGVLVNVTVVTPTHAGFLSLRPQGATGEPTKDEIIRFCVELAEEEQRRAQGESVKRKTIAEISEWLKTLVKPTAQRR